MKKIHIIGSTGSGKTHLSREIARRFMIKHYDLDSVVWKKDEPGRKWPDEVRDLKLKEILSGDSWIVEGVYHKWIGKSLESADLIVYLDPGVYVRDFRILYRFVKTRLGLEPSPYKQRLKGLVQMLAWNHKFERVNKYEIFALLAQYQDKTMIIKNRNELLSAMQRTP